MTKVGLAGEYMIEVRGADGSIRHQTDWFDNLITNQGMDRLGGIAAVFSRAMVGTGTVAPAYTQTTLQSSLATTTSFSSTATNSGAPLYQTQHLFTFTFTQGAVVGNITEVGVGWDATNVFSRALIVDGAQSPISITLTSIDQLTVYYRLTIRPVLTDTSGIVTISGVDYSYVGRLSQASSFFTNSGQFYSNLYDGNSFSQLALGWTTNSVVVYGAGSTLGTITSNAPTGTAASTNASATYIPYAAGSYYRDTTFTLSSSTGNAAGGIGAIRLYFGNTAYAAFQYSFSPVIPKDNTKTLSMTFRFSWTRL